MGTGGKRYHRYGYICAKSNVELHFKEPLSIQ